MASCRKRLYNETVLQMGGKMEFWPAGKSTWVLLQDRLRKAAPASLAMSVQTQSNSQSVCKDHGKHVIICNKPEAGERSIRHDLQLVGIQFYTFRINIWSGGKWFHDHLGFGVFLPSIQLSNQTPAPSLEFHFASNSVFRFFFSPLLLNKEILTNAN